MFETFMYLFVLLCYTWDIDGDVVMDNKNELNKVDENENSKMVKDNSETKLPRIAEMVLEKDEELVFFGTRHCNSKM